MKPIANLLLNGVALYCVSYIIPGITVVNFGSALVAILVISLLNLGIKPILLILTFPITVLTLGLFIFVINAFLFVVASILTPGFHVESLQIAMVGSVAYTLITMIFTRLVK